ncbi:MAG TPA: cyclic nucleotide-binding domain-containing protein, partial [Gemmatimonadaceae bacterium]|nr:cyclic nucleotide-binding domain-containing protein [Gemmatimonadaceae bacterium]
MTATNSTTFRAQLREIQFLDGLTDTDYHYLGSRVTPVAFGKGELLFGEGAERQNLFLLMSGSVAIEKGSAAGGVSVRLATLGAGEAIGEGLLLDETIHGTTAMALELTQTLALGREALREIIRERPTLYA